MTKRLGEAPVRRAVVSGSTFEERIGYARAVVDGDWVHVSGTTGFDYATMTISGDVVEQAEQCLHNIATALAEAGCTFADVVRVRYLLPAREDFEPCVDDEEPGGYQPQQGQYGDDGVAQNSAEGHRHTPFTSSWRRR